MRIGIKNPQAFVNSLAILTSLPYSENIIFLKVVGNKVYLYAMDRSYELAQAKILIRDCLEIVKGRLIPPMELTIDLIDSSKLINHMKQLTVRKCLLLDEGILLEFEPKDKYELNMQSIKFLLRDIGQQLNIDRSVLLENTNDGSQIAVLPYALLLYIVTEFSRYTDMELTLAKGHVIEITLRNRFVEAFLTISNKQVKGNEETNISIEIPLIYLRPLKYVRKFFNIEKDKKVNIILGDKNLLIFKMSLDGNVLFYLTVNALIRKSTTSK